VSNLTDDDFKFSEDGILENGPILIGICSPGYTNQREYGLLCGKCRGKMFRESEDCFTVTCCSCEHIAGVRAQEESLH
jgi:hypothetical protein